MKTASFGSISSGTMRPEDLIPTFAGELQWLTPVERTTEESNLLAEADALETDGDGYYIDAEAADEILESLWEALNEHAPAYGYFGAQDGDGACYGFWLSECFEQEFEGLKVNDLNDVSQNYEGEVLEVNDHGNMTLYYTKDNGLVEVWSLV